MLVARHVWVQIFQGCSFQQEIMLKWYYGDGGSKINLFCKINYNLSVRIKIYQFYLNSVLTCNRVWV